MSKIRVLLADDHKMLLDGIKAFLEFSAEIEIIGVASDGEQVLEQLDSMGHEIDVLVTDLAMPRMNGVEITEFIRKNYPKIKILVLTQHKSQSTISQLLNAGAKGYVLKNTGSEELENAIKRVYQGDTFLGSGVAERVAQAFIGEEESEEEVFEPIVVLSEREKQILRLVTMEWKTHEIAAKLKLSVHTVETHRRNLIKKLGVRNTVGLVRYAIRVGLVDEE